MLKNGSNLHKLLSDNGNSITNLVNEINTKFSHAFLTDDTPFPLPNEQELPSWDINITPEDVRKELLSLNSKKASGPDGIPNALYKLVADYISQPLCHLFCLSVNCQTFPTLFKTGHIVPVPKCSNPSINDLRPISLLIVPSKILERLVLNSVKNTFIKHFGNNQFSYRPKSSTTCAIIQLHDAVTQILEQNVKGALVLSYDFSKAFDTLTHQLIIKRLIECKFPCNMIRWIQSYLTNRSQKTVIGGVESIEIPVYFWSPSGIHFGPLSI